MFLKSYYVSQTVLELLGSKGTPASILEQGLQSLPNATDFNWFYLFFKLGFIFFLRHVLTMKTRLTLNLVCSPGWPWQHYNDSPASWVLELQLCVTIPSLIFFKYNPFLFFIASFFDSLIHVYETFWLQPLPLSLIPYHFLQVSPQVLIPPSYVKLLFSLYFFFFTKTRAEI